MFVNVNANALLLVYHCDYNICDNVTKASEIMNING